MYDTNPDASLLNAFEVELDGATHHLLCFVEPSHALERGIEGRAVLAEFTPDPEGGVDLDSLRINPVFIEAFARFMNEEAARSPDLAAEALNHAGDRLYIIDSRHPGDGDDDPPAGEVVGCFAVDDSGKIVPDSFEYNPEHLWIAPDTGGSSILASRAFHDWLHAGAGEGAGPEDV